MGGAAAYAQLVGTLLLIERDWTSAAVRANGA